MSAGWLAVADETRAAAQEQVPPRRNEVRSTGTWNPESFAQDQIRRLVGQVFRPGSKKAMKQIVFSAVDPEIEVGSICIRVGEVLAAGTGSDVAIVGGLPDPTCETDRRELGGSLKGGSMLRRQAIRKGRDLWLLTAPDAEDVGSAASVQAYLEEIRREFEYSIVQGPAASKSNGATVMAQFADGIILVVSAHNTRRAAAVKVKQALDEAQVPLLGAVLKDREFPIPESVYRRL